MAKTARVRAGVEVKEHGVITIDNTIGRDGTPTDFEKEAQEIYEILSLLPSGTKKELRKLLR